MCEGLFHSSHRDHKPDTFSRLAFSCTAPRPILRSPRAVPSLVPGVASAREPSCRGHAAASPATSVLQASRMSFLQVHRRAEDAPILACTAMCQQAHAVPTEGDQPHSSDKQRHLLRCSPFGVSAGSVMIASVMGHLNCSGAAASSSSSSWGIASAGGQCVACASFSRLQNAPVH